MNIEPTHVDAWTAFLFTALALSPLIICIVQSAMMSHNKNKKAHPKDKTRVAVRQNPR